MLKISQKKVQHGKRGEAKHRFPQIVSAFKLAKKKKHDLGQSPSTRSGILSSKEGQFCDDPNLGSGCSANTQK